MIKFLRIQELSSLRYIAEVQELSSRATLLKSRKCQACTTLLKSRNCQACATLLKMISTPHFEPGHNYPNIHNLFNHFIFPPILVSEMRFCNQNFVCACIPSNLILLHQTTFKIWDLKETLTTKFYISVFCYLFHTQILISAIHSLTDVKFLCTLQSAAHVSYTYKHQIQ